MFDSIADGTDFVTIRIDAIERERAALYVSLADPAVLRNGPAVVAARSRLPTVEAELTELTERWETLETIAAQDS